MTKQTKNEKGFTIIEVVLVLAIAGLIFLIVFLALPQLQRSRRDTQRQNDAGRAMAALESYAGNNNGSYPDDVTDFGTDVVGPYLTNNGVWDDPTTGAPYTAAAAAPTSLTDLASGEYWYETEAVCDGQTITATTGETRNVAFVIFQESGGQYCQDNR